MIAKLLLNSLYGRFGMDDCFTYSEIYSKKDYPKFEKQEGFKESIQDLIDLVDNYLVQLKNPKVEQKTNLDNGFETHNINISPWSSPAKAGEVSLLRLSKLVLSLNCNN